jgi:glycosyltransferase involved in cell wall biosynthesis
MKGRDFLIIGIQAWDIPIGSNCKNIAVEFSRHNRVLYVNFPLDRKTKFSKRNSDEVKKRQSVIAGEQDGLEVIDNNLWTFYPAKLVESINKIPPSRVYNYLNRRNNRIFMAEIRTVVEKLGFRDIILFNDSAMFLGFYAVELLKPRLSLYYIRDYLVMQPYFKKHGEKMEPQLAGKYDAVVANSDYLADYLRPHNKHSYMVGQGCDLTNFSPLSANNLPEDMRLLAGPVIGYLGFLTGLRLDIDLIAHLAKERPGYSIVLIGPEDAEFAGSELHQIDNIHFLGSKNEAELPSYINGFGVAINPQLVNQMTIGNYPRKIDEYLAMGKPTVATATTAMDYFKDHVYLSHDNDEFLTNIDLAIKEDSDELAARRIEFARSHSWENCVARIYEVIEKL